MRRTIALAAITGLLAGCPDASDHWNDWDAGRDSLAGTGDTLPGLYGIRLVPSKATISQGVDQDGKVKFKVMGKFVSGERDITGLAAFTVKNNFLGIFNGAAFVAARNRGGKTEVQAVVGSLVATAPVTINVKMSSVLPGAPKDAATKFKGQCNPGGVTIAYPETGALVPPNLADFSVMWKDATSDLWELSLQSPSTDLKLYTVKSRVRLSASVWNVLSTSNLSGSFSISVRGVKKSSLGTCTRSSQTKILVGPAALKGGVYYWTTWPHNAIMRYDFGQANKKPVEYISTKNFPKCVGCHAVSPDGSRLAFTDENHVAGIWSITDNKGLNLNAPKATYHAFTPDNKYLLASYMSRMSLRKAATGLNPISLDLGGPASHPEISPRGDAIVWSRHSTYREGTTINQGSLYTTTLDESTIGKPKLLLKQYHQDNFYYPAFSPDGKWVLFNKSMEGSYGSDQAELWIIRSTGGKPIMLARANKAKLLRNSWPRWAPFTQLYNGRSIWWFSFSSVRDYGTDLVNTGASHSKKVTQIWMCAFDPALAAKGKDPSFPAFWVPFQDLKSKNHIAQWTKTVPVVN